MDDLFSSEPCLSETLTVDAFKRPSVRTMRHATLSAAVQALDPWQTIRDVEAACSRTVAICERMRR